MGAMGEHGGGRRGWQEFDNVPPNRKNGTFRDIVPAGGFASNGNSLAALGGLIFREAGWVGVRQDYVLGNGAAAELARGLGRADGRLEKSFIIIQIVQKGCWRYQKRGWRGGG
jgi:hypothetical protein